MSFVVSSLITDMRQELNIINQHVSDSDFILFLNNVNEYFTGNYYMPTREREADLVLFGGVFEYALPSDFGYIIEPRRPYDILSKRFSHVRHKDFAHWLAGNKTSIKNVRNNSFLLVNWSGTSKSQIHDCQSLTTNGTVTISGDGSGLLIDQTIFTEGLSSIRFTVTASGGSTTITFTDMNQMDLSDFFNTGRFFLDLQCPSSNSANLTNVVLRLGNDSSNYRSMTATTRHRGDALGTGWGLLSFDPTTGTTTGTLDNTTIDYAAVIITHGTSGVSGTYRLDNIFGSQGIYHILPYYSTQNVTNSSGTFQSSVTSVADTVYTPPLFDSAFKYKTLEIAAAQKLNDQALASYFARELEPREKALKSRFPVQTSLQQTIWYRRSNKF